MLIKQLFSAQAKGKDEVVPTSEGSVWTEGLEEARGSGAGGIRESHGLWIFGGALPHSLGQTLLIVFLMAVAASS